MQSPDLAGKRVELLLPGVRDLAIMANAGYAAAVVEMAEMEAAAHTLGLNVTKLQVQRPDDIPPTMERLKGCTDALYACAANIAPAGCFHGVGRGRPIDQSSSVAPPGRLSAAT